MPVFQFRTVLAAIAMLAVAACLPEQEPPQSTVVNSRYNTRLDVQEIMALVLEPASESLWDSAGWILDASGYRELYPATDEEWDHMRAQAAVIVETGNSLALPGRAADDEAWTIYSNGLSEAGIFAMEAATARDEAAFFEAGAQLYSVCTACHQAYSPEINNRFDTEQAD